MDDCCELSNTDVGHRKKGGGTFYFACQAPRNREQFIRSSRLTLK